MMRTEEGDEPSITFRTNLGDVVTVSADNPLRFVVTGEHQQLKPYVLVRGRLEALLSRAVTYELLEYGEEAEIDGTPMFVIRSQGAIFPVMAMAELERQS